MYSIPFRKKKIQELIAVADLCMYILYISQIL